MKFAFFNWRDIRHPNAGGAEFLIHNLMLQLAKKGHKVTLFTSKYDAVPDRDMIDGIEHIRYGNKYTLYPRSYFMYKKHIMGKYDAILESINGIPFFTVLYSKEKSIAYIHQLTRENWYSGLPFPFAMIVYLLENTFLSFYRKPLAIVPSKSTYDDLKSLGFQKIDIIPGAGNIVPPKNIQKAKEKTLVYLGRITKSKQVDHAVKTFQFFRDRYPDSKLWIVGAGPEEKKLRSMCKPIPGISFFGFVDERKKAELLSKAHVLLFPAVREGWGLVVLEANSCGTPVVGYDVPGLRDSIMNGVNGYTVKKDDYQAMARKAISIVEGDYGKISRSSIEYSKKFSWERSADEILKRLMA